MCTNVIINRTGYHEPAPPDVDDGIPETIVTYNATALVGEEFVTFMSRNGVKHVTTYPHHPAGNGLAERTVPIRKDGLK